jgi:hypothetical protein
MWCERFLKGMSSGMYSRRGEYVLGCYLHPQTPMHLPGLEAPYLGWGDQHLCLVARRSCYRLKSHSLGWGPCTSDSRDISVRPVREPRSDFSSAMVYDMRLEYGIWNTIDKQTLSFEVKMSRWDLELCLPLAYNSHCPQYSRQALFQLPHRTVHTSRAPCCHVSSSPLLYAEHPVPYPAISHTRALIFLHQEALLSLWPRASLYQVPRMSFVSTMIALWSLVWS